MSAERLYTPDVLALSIELANWPAIETAPLHAETRSSTCGSTLAMDLVVDANERIGARWRYRSCHLVRSGLRGAAHDDTASSATGRSASGK